MSRSVLEWKPVEGFLNKDENQIVHESDPENKKLFMKVPRASFGAVATSAKNKVAVIAPKYFHFRYFSDLPRYFCDGRSNGF